jgi:four helix bundle protein
MAGVKTFTELAIWNRARQWSKAIFGLAKRQPFTKDRRLVVQVNDSSSSVCANIAEGFGRGTQGEFVMFLGYAIGSLNETQSHLSIAFDREYILASEFAQQFREGTEIRKQIVAFKQAMNKPGGGVKNLRPHKSWNDRRWEQFERVTGQSRPDWAKPKPDKEEGSRVPSTEYRVLSTER